MQTYAVLDSEGRPARVYKSREALDPLPENVLPVVYPEIPVDRLTHGVRQKPVSEWPVEGGKVTVAYSVTPYDFNKMRTSLEDAIPSTREAVLARGVEIELEGTQAVLVATSQARTEIDELSRDAQLNPEGWSRRWRDGAGVWFDLTPQSIETLRATLVEFVKQTNSEQESLEVAAADAQGLGLLRVSSALRDWVEGDLNLTEQVETDALSPAP